MSGSMLRSARSRESSCGNNFSFSPPHDIMRLSPLSESPGSQSSTETLLRSVFLFSPAISDQLFIKANQIQF